jgi:hypothetical protein
MDEYLPVEDSEYVFRRIHPDFFDASLAIPVTREAFRPTKKDSAGLQSCEPVLQSRRIPWLTSIKRRPRNTTLPNFR